MYLFKNVFLFETPHLKIINTGYLHINYQDHEWRVFWDVEGEERLVEEMDTCHYLSQALEMIESIVETDYDALMDELELEDEDEDDEFAS